MYIETWVFWLMVIAIIYLLLKEAKTTTKCKQILTDFGNTYDKTTKCLILAAWHNAKTKAEKKRQFELIIKALERGAEEGVVVNRSYLESTDLLACCTIFRTIKIRDTLAKVRSHERKCDDFDDVIREDLGRWLGYKDYEKPTE